MKDIVLRHMKSGYPITITPYKEDSKYWYVIENTNGDILMPYGIRKYILTIWEKDNEGREDKWMSAGFFDIDVFAASGIES